MTPEDVRRRVAGIATTAEGINGNESAHAEEEELYIDVLKAIAAGAENPAELAAAALEVLKLEFDRWYS